MTDKLAIDRNKLREAYPLYMGGDWRSRIVGWAVVLAGAALAFYAMDRLEFSVSRLGSGLENLRAYIALMLHPTAGSQFAAWLTGMAETLAIAFLGTMIAAALAFPLGLLAARNILPNFVVRFVLRRGLDTMRSVDVLIWALVWINVVGLGPFAGVLAIASSDFGALGKLFSEAIENVDRKAADGVTASGGNALQRVRFGILPEALPVLASQILYFFESNTRSATIIGIVGAGGIGRYLKESIDQFEWEKVSLLIILVLIVVAIIDFISSRLRSVMIGTREVTG
jgi:phosphonate transport system permease protein